MPGSAQLTIKSDVGSQQFTLPTGSYVIGSEDSSDLVVPSPGIRPQHARLTITQDHFETEEIDVEDAGHGQHASEVAATTTPVPRPRCGPRFGGT